MAEAGVVDDRFGVTPEGEARPWGPAARSSTAVGDTTVNAWPNGSHPLSGGCMPLRNVGFFSLKNEAESLHPLVRRTGSIA